MTREQRKQQRKRAVAFVLMLLFAVAVCATCCLAYDGAAVEAADGWTRFLLILGAAALTDILMRAAFWLDGVK